MTLGGVPPYHRPMHCHTCQRPEATSLARLNNWGECRRRISAASTDIDARSYLISECSATACNTKAHAAGLGHIVDLVERLRVGEAWPIRPVMWVTFVKLAGVTDLVPSIHVKVTFQQNHLMHTFDWPSRLPAETIENAVRDVRDHVVIQAMNSATR